MRVLVILSTVVASLGIALWALAAFGSPTATKAGRSLYPHRGAMAMLEDAARRPQPAVVWLGDSTLAGKPFVSYPELIQRDELRSRGLRSTVVGVQGLDTYAFHSLTWEALALRPRVVVLIANFRAFPTAGVTTRTFDDLTAFVPTRALPGLLTLPYHFRGMTAPRLFLTRTLRYDWACDWFFWVQGSRDELQRAAAWTILGPEEPTLASNAAVSWVLGWQKTAEAYDHPITSGHPLVRFLAASVAEITAAGAAALVVVTPIPHAVLAEAGHYDPRVFAARVGVLRAAVDREGGTLLDLHDALEQSLFRDRSGHFSVEGTERMRQLVWPIVWHLLGGPAPRPGPRHRPLAATSSG
jgi:hypothetical protein